MTENKKRKTTILLRSSWQVVNIGDIAHTPGVLALFEKKFPEAEFILWASPDLSDEVMEMEHKRFPNLKIVKGNIDDNGIVSNEELKDAIEKSDFLLHGSAPYLVAWVDLEKYKKFTGKPYGVFGITYLGDLNEKEVLNKAEFVYFRDSASLEKAKEVGVSCPVIEFGPDGAFATDLRNDKKATEFLKENKLEDGKYLCCIPKHRFTPYWEIRNVPFDPVRNELNERMAEHDHKPLREAIFDVVKNTDLKVLLCPEDETEIKVGKEHIYDKLPEDIKERVVWRNKFWLTDEALSVYVRSVGLFGNEMHSPIMCIGNEIPAIVCRWKEQTTKGIMWRDIGLGDWLFDMDNEEDVAKIHETVLKMARDFEGSMKRAIEAKAKVDKLFDEMVGKVKEITGY